MWIDNSAKDPHPTSTTVRQELFWGAKYKKFGYAKRIPLDLNQYRRTLPTTLFHIARYTLDNVIHPIESKIVVILTFSNRNCS